MRVAEIADDDFVKEYIKNENALYQWQPFWLPLLFINL